MKNTRKEFKRLLSEFLDVAETNNIWYALDGVSLLGIARHGGFIPWEEKIQVMMTQDSYKGLRRVSKGRVIDSSDNSAIKKLAGYFVDDNKDISSPQGFVEIRILAPTTVRKLHHFRSLNYLLTNKLKNRKINTKTALNDLGDMRFEGYLPLESRKQNVHKSWIQSISFDTETKMFNDIEVKIPVEYKRYLKEWHGEEFMTAHVPNTINKYISPIETIKETI